jgi:hypothetical protein
MVATRRSAANRSAELEGFRGILLKRWFNVSTGIIRILLMLRAFLVCRKTALMYAAETDRVPLATALIDTGADLNAKTGNGCAYFQARKCWFALPPGRTRRSTSLRLSLQRLQSDHRIRERAP